jgi:hypothetical protein
MQLEVVLARLHHLLKRAHLAQKALTVICLLHLMPPPKDRSAKVVESPIGATAECRERLNSLV